MATKVGTHSSTFHSDEIIAIALIKYSDDVEVIRSRSELVLGEAEILVDVGREYSPKEAKYDHHQFKRNDPFYGLSSAGLVWKDVKDSVTADYKALLPDLEAFIDAVDRRDTRFGYDPSNVYEPVFDAITACNHIDPMSKEQDYRFNMMLDIVENIIDALCRKDTEAYAIHLEGLEALAEKYTKEKLPQYDIRQTRATELDEVVVAKFFPTWRSASKEIGKPFIIPGDVAGQFKVMVDTYTTQIATTRDEVFTHDNGFISIVEPSETSTHIGIALTNGKLIEVSLEEIKELLGEDYA